MSRALRAAKDRTGELWEFDSKHISLIIGPPRAMEKFENCVQHPCLSLTDGAFGHELETPLHGGWDSLTHARRLR